MRLYFNHYFALVLVIMASVFALAVTSQESSTSAANLGTCPGSIAIVSLTQGQTLLDITPVKLSGPSNVVRVKYFLDGNVMGTGFQEPVSGHEWRMSWDVRFAQPGSHDVTAHVLFDNGDSCDTSPITVFKASTVVDPLQVNLSPPDWSGLTNSVVFFDVLFEDPNNTSGLIYEKYADVVWSVSGKGTILPEPYSTGRYSAGPDGGGGEVQAIISYGGQKITRLATTEIIPQYEDNTETDDNTDTTDNSGSSDADTITENDSEFEDSTILNSDQYYTQANSTTYAEPAEAITQILEEDKETKSCIENVLGEDEVKRLLEEDRRPNGDEFEKYIVCFARQNYVLPSILAPVAPELVAEKQELAGLRIANIGNAIKTRSEDGKKTTILVFSGTAAPNSNVLLYIFSEPLVLSTIADSDGNWSYSLEDPLEGGNHEVYAMVDRGDGEYERSSVASFIIGTAEASEENPSGYSLNLLVEPTATANNRSINLFIAVTVGIVTFAGTLVFGYIIYKRKNSQPQATLGSFTAVNVNPQDPNFKDFTSSL